MELAELIPHLAAHAPSFASRMAAAGVDPGSIRQLSDLDALPVFRKAQLVSLQATSPPFGGLLAAPLSEIKGVYQSPGPIYTPEPARADAWRWAPALAAAGFARGQVVMNTFSYHLSPAGVRFHEGLVKLGCAVVPGGVGNQEQQVKVLHQLGITGYVGLPSYLKALLDKASELGLPLSLQRAFVAAEPLPPSLRDAIEAQGVQVRQGYGTAETGNLGFECEALSGWHVPEDVWVQICDITDGRPLPDGEPGEVVVTSQGPHYALVRFGVGDLSSLDRSPCSCGRHTPRLLGWQGRVDAAVKVRGLFVHPRQLAELVGRFPSVSAWQAVITRVDHKDALTIQVVSSDPGVVAAIEAAAPAVLKLRAAVEAVSSVATSGQLVDQRSWD